MGTTDSCLSIGVMSGTSLDGLDIAMCRFTLTADNIWKHKILEAETIAYTPDWKKKLQKAPALPGKELYKLDHEFGRLIGRHCKALAEKTNLQPDLVASHGHTVFHAPKQGYGLQIGNGHDIASYTNTKVVYDFRSLDLSLGGQGAPLVPVGDHLLFEKYDYCLNLGGFSNISYEQSGKRMAFDICPVNNLLNHISKKEGLDFDHQGQTGRKGKVSRNLFNELNAIPYYHQRPPKSLGREDLERDFFPILEKYKTSNVDKLRTIYEHIMFQICKVAGIAGNKQILITGGGAKNSFLTELLQQNTELDIIIPNTQLIDYKEALIFAFLGVLRVKMKINCFSSVTGASNDSSCGVIVYR